MKQVYLTLPSHFTRNRYCILFSVIIAPPSHTGRTKVRYLGTLGRYHLSKGAENHDNAFSNI